VLLLTGIVLESHDDFFKFKTNCLIFLSYKSKFEINILEKSILGFHSYSCFNIFKLPFIQAILKQFSILIPQVYILGFHSYNCFNIDNLSDAQTLTNASGNKSKLFKFGYHSCNCFKISKFPYLQAIKNVF